MLADDVDAPLERRAAVTWVAATGAALVLAAAGVFTAVRWSSVSETAKLTALSLLTAVMLGMGVLVRPKLPATANALVHLGVLLAPIDAWAVAVVAGADWPVVLVASGVTAAAVAAALGRALDSITLRLTAVIGLGVASAGVGALLGGTAPAIAAGIAALLLVLGVSRAAALLATGAGLAPVIAIVVVGPQAVEPRVGIGVARDIGVLAAPWWQYAIVAATCCVVLLVSARRRTDVRLAWCALAVAVAQGASIVAEPSGDPRVRVLTVAAAFLLLELVALLVRSDEILGPPFMRAGELGEAIALVPAPFAAIFVVMTLREPAAFGGRGSLIVAAAMLAAGGWIFAGLRGAQSPIRWLRGFDEPWTQVPVALAILTAVSAGGGSPTVVGAAALGLAVLAVVGEHRYADALLVPLLVLVAIAPVARAGVVFGAVAGVAVVVAHRRRGGTNTLTVLTAAIALALASAQLMRIAGVGPAVLTFEVGLLAVAFGLRPARDDAPLVAAAAVVAAALLAPRVDATACAAATSAMAVVLATARDRATRAVAVVPWMQLLATAGALVVPTNPHQRAVVFAVVGAGLLLAGELDDRVGLELEVSAGAAAALAAGVAGVDAPAAFGPLLVILGAAIATVGAWRARAVIVLTGATVATVGGIIVLANRGVRTVELYTAPVGLVLLAAGSFVAHRRPARSSWSTLAPGIVVLCAPSTVVGLDERATGHLLVAGTVAIVCVAIGAARRLAAPLFLGTATLFAVGIPTTFGYARGVPAWTWLALGGSTLLVVAVVLERADEHPGLLGRRVVDVVVRAFR